MPPKILLEKLRNLELSPENIGGFLNLLEKFQAGSKTVSNWEALCSPDPQHLPDLESLPEVPSLTYADQLKRLVVLKLNGGLGTSMGCSGPKSAIQVREGQTFLDLIIEQVSSLNRISKVPLVLMNSFYTHAATQKTLNSKIMDVEIHTFEQNRFPRLAADSLLPLEGAQWEEEAWYPPGHGDLFSCLSQQQLLDRWLQEGRDVLFVSNADNLGAIADSRILNFIIEQDIPFLMEMTLKTPADVKGGTLYQLGNDLHLLEIGNVPEAHLAEFVGMEKFRVFNTNNIWINLRHLQNRMDEGPLDLGVIANRKRINQTEVIQLETAVGAGLDNFERAAGLVVSRDRFAPVKTTADLLKIQSDLYLNREGQLMCNPDRDRKGLPEIKLDDRYSALELFQEHFPAPLGLKDLDSLDIVGNVRFEGPATLKGTVYLAGIHKPLVIRADSVLQDCRKEA